MSLLIEPKLSLALPNDESAAAAGSRNDGGVEAGGSRLQHLVRLVLPLVLHNRDLQV